jgi:hypothetical protein
MSLLQCIEVLTGGCHVLAGSSNWLFNLTTQRSWQTFYSRALLNFAFHNVLLIEPSNVCPFILEKDQKNGGCPKMSSPLTFISVIFSNQNEAH